MTKIKSTTLDKIKKSPGGADHDIDASAQWTKLILVTYAAIDADHSGVSTGRRGDKIGSHLAGQLPGRRHNQRLRSAGPGELRIVAIIWHDDPLQQGNAEGQGLAGAGPRLTDHVGTCQGNGNG
jgi:hypothetical protein